MLEIFLALIARIFAAYEAKFHFIEKPIIPYKKAIGDGSVSYFEKLCEYGKKNILQILETIIAGRFSDILKQFEGGLAFNFGEKGGQLKSLIVFALSSYDPTCIALLLKQESIKVPTADFEDSCPGEGNHICCCECDRCEITREKTRIMNVGAAQMLPYTPCYKEGTRVLGGTIRELGQLKQDILIFILISNIKKGSLWSKMRYKKPLISGMKHTLIVNGRLVMNSHYTCKPEKNQKTTCTTLDLNGGDSLCTLLSRFWSDPEVDANEGRVLSMARRQMVWTVMHVAERLEILPSEIWLLIMTFVKHV